MTEPVRSPWGGREVAVDGAPVLPVAADVAELLLGAPEVYTRGQVSAAAGVDPAVIRRYWRALGFASAADDAVAFTDSDVAALRGAQGLQGDLELSEEEMVRLIRAVGRTTARLAEWVTE
jgi:adenylate cyclase